MSASLPSDLVAGAPARPDGRRRGALPFAALRLGIGLDRSMWPADRALAELRWGAIPLGLMLVLAMAGHVVADPTGRYDHAAQVSGVAFLIMAFLAWGPFATRVASSAVVRRVTGPAVVLVAVSAAGPYDPATLAATAGTPFIIAALAYAALTPGFTLAVLLLSGASGWLLIEHARLPGHAPLDAHAVDFLVRLAVLLATATAMHLVDRGLRRERRRAERLAARKGARADQLEGLQRIVHRFDGSRPVAEVMQDVVTDVASTFGITLASAYLPDASGRLSMVGVHGYDSPFHVIEPGVGIIGRAAADRRTVYTADVLADPDYRAARPDVRSEVATPVLHGDELLGIVNFEGTAARPIGPSHVAVAEMLASSIAGALRSARLDEERRERSRAIERVLDVSRALAADLDRGRIVAAVVDAAVELLGADGVAFAGRALDGHFVVERAVGATARPVGSTLPVGDHPPARVADRPSELWLPISTEGATAAILAASKATGGTFSDLDRQIADLLVTQTESALHNADLHARVSEAAVRDPLTGLLNRRFFDEAIETTFANAIRSETPLSLIVLDLDRFSEVNNDHGHAVGDAVLRRAARAIAATVRTGDIVARYGGEEFVVIAPGTDRDDAVAVAERIRGAVATEARRAVDGIVVPLTISAGVATRLGDEPDGRALFRAADSALLAAKRGGRDRVVSL